MVVGGQDIEKGRLLLTCPMPRNAFVRVKHQNHAWKEREQKGKGKAILAPTSFSLKHNYIILRWTPEMMLT